MTWTWKTLTRLQTRSKKEARGPNLFPWETVLTGRMCRAGRSCSSSMTRSCPWISSSPSTSSTTASTLSLTQASTKTTKTSLVTVIATTVWNRRMKTAQKAQLKRKTSISTSYNKLTCSTSRLRRRYRSLRHVKAKRSSISRVWLKRWLIKRCCRKRMER